MAWIFNIVINGRALAFCRSANGESYSRYRGTLDIDYAMCGLIAWYSFFLKAYKGDYLQCWKFEVPYAPGLWLP